jgi:prolyl 4-hydroxylase
MLGVENPDLDGGGESLRRKIQDAAKVVIQEWTGMELQPTSIYGIRVYTEDAVLSPHVDRLPLVSSCIVNVAQDVDEDWPLTVIDRQGNEVNVTMEPGDMVLYESGSLVHGRPYPLKGRYFANIFVHFEPTGRKLGDETQDYLEELDDFYPPYLMPDSPWLDHWAKQNPGGWRKPSPSLPRQQTTVDAQAYAAGNGDYATMLEIATNEPASLHKKDALGWQSIHEAARGGFTDIVKLLLEHGIDKNSRTGLSQDGASPLHVALYYLLDEDAEVVKYLKSIGAEDIPFDSTTEEL